MPQSILIVEDQPELAQMIADLLEEAGYATHLAADGEQALAALAAQPPDLVLTDVNMPGLDGYGLAERIKTIPTTAGIPIVMMSAQDGRGARVIGLQSGAVDYLAKPLDPAELLAKVRNLLQLRC